jgi:hypothetical protein
MTYLYGLMNGQTAVPKTLFHNDCYFLLVLRFKILANPIWPTPIVRMHITTCMVLTYAPGLFSCQWTHHLWQTKKSRSSKSSLPLLAANIDQPAHTKTMAKHGQTTLKKGFQVCVSISKHYGFPTVSRFPSILSAKSTQSPGVFDWSPHQSPDSAEVVAEGLSLLSPSPSSGILISESTYPFLVP